MSWSYEKGRFLFSLTTSFFDQTSQRVIYYGILFLRFSSSPINVAEKRNAYIKYIPSTTSKHINLLVCPHIWKKTDRLLYCVPPSSPPLHICTYVRLATFFFKFSIYPWCNLQGMFSWVREEWILLFEK